MLKSSAVSKSILTDTICFYSQITNYTMPNMDLEYSLNDAVEVLAKQDITNFCRNNTTAVLVVYKGFVLQVYCTTLSFFCGNIQKFPEYIRNVFSDAELCNLNAIEGLIKAHGDWLGTGFCCNTSRDIRLEISEEACTIAIMRQIDMIGATFKTPSYVLSKLQQAVDNILEIYDTRIDIV